VYGKGPSPITHNLTVAERPELEDEVALRRDQFYGVAYASDYPAAPPLQPDHSIEYANESSWRLDVRRELDLCHRKDMEKWDSYRDMFVDDNDPDFLLGLKVAQHTSGSVINPADERYPFLLEVLNSEVFFPGLKMRMRNFGRDLREEGDHYREAVTRHSVGPEDPPPPYS